MSRLADVFEVSHLQEFRQSALKERNAGAGSQLPGIHMIQVVGGIDTLGFDYAATGAGLVSNRAYELYPPPIHNDWIDGITGVSADKQSWFSPYAPGASGLYNTFAVYAWPDAPYPPGGTQGKMTIWGPTSGTLTEHYFVGNAFDEWTIEQYNVPPFGVILSGEHPDYYRTLTLLVGRYEEFLISLTPGIAGTVPPIPGLPEGKPFGVVMVFWPGRQPSDFPWFP